MPVNYSQIWDKHDFAFSLLKVSGLCKLAWLD
jgi:hypothetical protein